MTLSGPMTIARDTVARLARRQPRDVSGAIVQKITRFEDEASEHHGAVLSLMERLAEANTRCIEKRRELARQRDLGRRPGHTIDPGTDFDALRAKAVADAEADATEAEAVRDRLRERLEDARARWQAAKHQAGRLRDFFASTAPGALVAAATPDTKGWTAETVRAEIRKTEASAEATRVAPLPRAELIRAIEAEVDAAAKVPSVSATRRDGRPARLAEALRIAAAGPGGSIMGDAGAGTWTWLLADLLKERLVELIPESIPGALTDAQRDRKLADLANRKLELERIEEHLIQSAEREGRAVQRRSDASPLAILGVEIVGGGS